MNPNFTFEDEKRDFSDLKIGTPLKLHGIRKNSNGQFLTEPQLMTTDENIHSKLVIEMTQKGWFNEFVLSSILRDLEKQDYWVEECYGIDLDINASYKLVENGGLN